METMLQNFKNKQIDWPIRPRKQQAFVGWRQTYFGVVMEDKCFSHYKCMQMQ